MQTSQGTREKPNATPVDVKAFAEAFGRKLSRDFKTFSSTVLSKCLRSYFNLLHCLKGELSLKRQCNLRAARGLCQHCYLAQDSYIRRQIFLGYPQPGYPFLLRSSHLYHPLVRKDPWIVVPKIKLLQGIKIPMLNCFWGNGMLLIDTNTYQILFKCLSILRG